MCQRRYLGHIAEACFAQHIVGHGSSGSRSEQGADVDCHIEQTESGITFRAILRSIIQITYHYLQISLEKSGSQSNQGKSAEHGIQSDIGCHRDSQQHITGKHDNDTGSNHLAITEFIGQDTSDKRHEIHSCQETGKDC